MLLSSTRTRIGVVSASTRRARGTSYHTSAVCCVAVPTTTATPRLPTTEVSRSYAGNVSRADQLRLAGQQGKVASLFKEGNFTAALPLAEALREETSAIFGEEHPATASAINNEAIVRKNLGDFEAAAALYQRAVMVYDKAYGQENTSYLTALNNLASVLRLQGKSGEALPLLELVLEKRRKLLGENHFDVATTLSNLAAVYREGKDYDKAIELQLQACEILRPSPQKWGETAVREATARNDLGLIYKCKGDYDRALDLYRQAADVRKEQLGEQHPSHITSLHNIAECLLAAGREDESREVQQKILEILKYDPSEQGSGSGGGGGVKQEA